jgi:hypothetical protein
MNIADTHNLALNLAPFGRWTLCDEAAQRRLALRYPSTLASTAGLSLER